MTKYLLALVLVATVGVARAEAPAAPVVTALLTTETTEVDGEGVTRTSRFQERFYRDDTHVWIERVYPAGVTAAAGGEHGVNLRVASRWYSRVAPGSDEVKVALVSVADETMVELAPSEYANLGVSPRWSVAAQLVDLGRLVPSS